MLVQYKSNSYEPLYTLTEAEKIIDWNRSKAAQKRNAERIYYIKQKLLGIVMLVMGIIIPFLGDDDATFSLIAVPFGLFLFVTDRNVMMFKR